MSAPPSAAGRSTIVAALGVSLLLLGLYVATSPGRIDMIDGQFRYEVARNWLDVGRPVVLDRALASVAGLRVRTPTAVYSVYNAAGSITPMPLMLLSRALPGHNAERERFFFAMTGPVFGATLGGVLVVAYSMLGVPLRRAVAWALVCGVATLWWPGSTTVFDQNQHAVWLLLALVLAWESGRRASVHLALLAGVAGGVLVTYQESYAVLLPLVGLAVVASPLEARAMAVSLPRTIERATLWRYLAFALASAAGLVALLAFNYARFGTAFYEGRYDDPLTFADANPLAAFLGLAVSPGKSLFLFSPPLVLAVLGARRLFARAPALAIAIALASLAHLLVIVQVVFFAGDWCWGPRYMLILVPMWALAFPLAAEWTRRALVVALVSLGVLTQVLAVSVDHHRFFLERNLSPHFWATDLWFYFRDSQLVARPGEVWAMWRDGVPGEATMFISSPWRDTTSAPFGLTPARANISARWMRSFQAFYLPRPWPLWTAAIDPALRPITPWPMLLVCVATLVAGAWAVARTLRPRTEA